MRRREDALWRKREDALRRTIEKKNDLLSREGEGDQPCRAERMSRHAREKRNEREGERDQPRRAEKMCRRAREDASSPVREEQSAVARR